MASPQLAQSFPDFEIDNLSIKQAKSEGPVLVVVWRTDCPTCQMAMPFFDRIASRYKAAKIVSIGQADIEAVKEFSSQYKLTMEHHADPHLRISKFLGVDTVPEYWLVGRDGKVAEMGKGWDANKLESIAQKLATQSSAPYSPLIVPADNVPVFKPG
jgi:thiol-disulfide isomerase/thioredoxin